MKKETVQQTVILLHVLANIFLFKAHTIIMIIMETDIYVTSFIIIETTNLQLIVIMILVQDF